jgi:DNA-directed RNA polymerase subunit omega
MMVEPALSDLMKKTDCRYTLVIEAAKRARQLTSGAKKLTETTSINSVTIAVKEISEDKITYLRTKSGIK